MPIQLTRREPYLCSYTRQGAVSTTYPPIPRQNPLTTDGRWPRFTGWWPPDGLPLQVTPQTPHIPLMEGPVLVLHSAPASPVIIPSGLQY